MIGIGVPYNKSGLDPFGCVFVLRAPHLKNRRKIIVPSFVNLT